MDRVGGQAMGGSKREVRGREMESREGMGLRFGYINILF